MKPVSVIILNWNGAEMIRRFLPSVLSTTNSAIADVIVADNGSSDNSLEILCNEFPEVKIISFDKNYGFAEGYNRALTEVETEYAVLLNSDVEPAPGWLEELYDFMKTRHDVVATQPKILSVFDRDTFEYAGACGGFIDRNGYPYCRGRIFDTVEKDCGQYNEPVEVDWASGAALMVRRDVYISIGGLDSQFFAHMEEIDLCWRFRLKGYRVAAVPSSVVYHFGGGSLQSTNPRKTYLNFRNNLLMLYKNLPHKDRRKRLLLRRLLDTFAWGKFMAAGKFSHANAILKAHSDFRRMKKQYDEFPAAERNLIEDAPNVLTQYFLHRRKTFSKIKNRRS